VVRTYGSFNAKRKSATGEIDERAEDAKVGDNSNLGGRLNGNWWEKMKPGSPPKTAREFKCWEESAHHTNKGQVMRDAGEEDPYEAE